MKHPYISGPMTSYSNHNFPAFFEADHKLRDFGYEPINPAAEKLPPGGRWSSWEDAYMHAQDNPVTWHEYLKRDLSLVLESDGIVLLRGWNKSKGACLEVVTAISIELPVFQYVENYSASCLELFRADAEATLKNALAYLVQCGTRGVAVQSNGRVKYI